MSVAVNGSISYRPYVDLLVEGLLSMLILEI